MKRLAIALSIIVLLAVLSPCLSSLAQPTHIPHQNPAWAKDSPGLTSLLLFYSNAFELASISQYQDAQILLDELENKGMHYQIAVVQTGADLEAPGLFPTGLIDVRLTDRDAILVREGLDLTLETDTKKAGVSFRIVDALVSGKEAQ